MEKLNLVVLQGTLAAPSPDHGMGVEYTRSGTKTVRFVIAQEREVEDRVYTTRVLCAAYGDVVEQVLSLQPGQQVVVHGRLTSISGGGAKSANLGIMARDVLPLAGATEAGEDEEYDEAIF